MLPKTEDLAMRSPNSHPIKGHYQRRMEALLDQPDIKHTRRASAEIIALLSLEMSHGYRKILVMLYTHPLLSIEGTRRVRALHPRTTYRYVLELSHWGCLECFHQSSGKGNDKQKTGPAQKGGCTLGARSQGPALSVRFDGNAH